MKASKYLFGVALAAAALLATSCDTDNEGTIYRSQSQNVSFENDGSSTTTAQTSITVPVRVIRGNKNGAYTATYTAQASDDGIFSDDAGGSISFADGETAKTINVTASNLAVGQTYTYTLTLTNADADTVTQSAITQTVVTIHSEYNWVSAGTCTFIDFNFAEGDEGASVDGVPIQHAEGTNIYRLVEPYRVLYGESEWSTSNQGNIQFTLNADGSAGSIPSGVFSTFAGYSFYYDAANYGTYCTFTNQGNHFTVGHLLTPDMSSLYIGQFDWIWTEGYPGQQ